MINFKNVEIKGNVNGANSKLTVSLEVVGTQPVLFHKGQDVPELFTTSKGFIVPDSKMIADKLKSRIIINNILTAEGINELLNEFLGNIKKSYEEIAPSDLDISIKEFYGIDKEINFSKNTEVKEDVEEDSLIVSPDFFNKKFVVDELAITEDPFAGKIKALLNRFLQNRYQDTFYIYGSAVPEGKEPSKYDLFGINYEVIDENDNEKIIFNTVPVSILCELFNISALDLYEYCDEAISRFEYKKQYSKY